MFLEEGYPGGWLFISSPLKQGLGLHLALDPVDFTSLYQLRPDGSALGLL